MHCCVCKCAAYRSPQLRLRRTHTSIHHCAPIVTRPPLPAVAVEAPHVRAAACSCLAFLASHPLSARGDECMTGPFRRRLLAAGAFSALLRSALIAQAALAESFPGEEPPADNPNQIVMQAAAVGLMHLCTQVGHCFRQRCCRCCCCRWQGRACLL